MQTTFGLISIPDLIGNTLIIGDVAQVLKEFPVESIDLIYSDEPYTDLEASRNIGTTTRLKHSEASSNDWYQVIKYHDVIPFYAKVLKNGKHIYMWRPSFTQDSIKNWCELIDPNYGLYADNNFTIRKIIPVPKMYGGLGYSWRSKHEYLIFAYKNDLDMLQLNDKSMTDYFDDVVWLPRKHQDRTHVSQKPFLVAKKILYNSSKPGDFVLEPFAGGFTSARINHDYNMQRNVIGIEKDDKIANKTIQYFKDNEIPLSVINFTDLG